MVYLPVLREMQTDNRRDVASFDTPATLNMRTSLPQFVSHTICDGVSDNVLSGGGGGGSPHPFPMSGMTRKQR